MSDDLNGSNSFGSALGDTIGGLAGGWAGRRLGTSIATSAGYGAPWIRAFGGGGKFLGDLVGGGIGSQIGAMVTGGSSEFSLQNAAVNAAGGWVGGELGEVVGGLVGGPVGAFVGSILGDFAGSFIANEMFGGGSGGSGGGTPPPGGGMPPPPPGGMGEDPFSVAVGQWVDQAGAQALDAYRAIALAAVARVKELTPVKTGYLRANWTALIAGDAMPVAGQVPPAEETLAKLQLGDAIVIVNPVIYARRIEFGFVGEDSLGRHYNQPGRGMLQQTISELPQIAREAVQQVTGR